jgi:dolichol kinase
MTASLVGRNYGNPSGERSRIWPIKGKTLAGSIAFFLTALIISSFFYHRKMGMNIGSALAMGAGIAFATTIGEAWSVNGFDNLFIPVITLIIMCLYAFF